MSQRSLAEKALLTLSSANFQKLGDAYLRHFRGWKLQSWGTMAGADKDKIGVPDAYAQLPDDRYVLVAYTTTMPPRLAKKLAEDLADCLVEAKPYLANEVIERIVLVYNNRISLATHERLKRQASSQGVNLEMVGLDDVVDMVIRHPAIAAQHINLDLGRGQLVHGADFVEIYGRQLGATPLTHHLYGRESEQASLRDKLADASLVLVHGSAGVGKTQLVVTTCQAYCAEAPNERQLYFVYDKKSADFIRELQFVLVPGQQIIVVADDANRVSPYFDQLLAEQRTRPIGALKIVATVRDYAREAVQQAARQTKCEEVEVKPLVDEAIKALLEKDYGIRNPRYVDRILEICEGRPRLAIMAANAAKEAQRIDRLHNVADIYESYFGPILEDLEARQNPQLIKVLALIHFFRVLHQSHAELATQVTTTFGIEPDDFWATAQDLHEAELVEMHADRVVKSADQILGNFVFHRVFFGRRPTLSYQKLLLSFFPSWQSRVVDTLNGVLNDFGLATIEPKIRPSLNAWLRRPVVNEEERWKFYHVFWPFLRGEILSAAQNHLRALPWPEQPASAYVVTEGNHQPYVHEPGILLVLKDLTGQPTDELPNALALLMEMAAKKPDLFNKILEFLRGLADFDVRQYDSYGLHIQETVLRVLVAGTHDASHGDFYRWLLAHILPSCLATSFSGAYAGRTRGSIMMAQFDLPVETDVKTWREQIWRELFGLFEHNTSLAVNAIQLYLTRRHHGGHSAAWREWDAELLIPLLDSYFDPSQFIHCKFIHDYCYWLEGRVKHTGIKGLRKKFNSRIYKLYAILVYNQQHQRNTDRRHIGLWGDKLDEFIRARVKPLHYTSLESYDKLIDDYHELYPQVEKEQYQLTNSLAAVFEEVITRDRKLGIKVFRYLLSTGNPTGIHPWHGIKALAGQDYEKGYAFINGVEYKAKPVWQHLYLTHLPAHLANEQWLAELFRVFDSGITSFDFRRLEVYANLSPTLYPDLLEQVLNTVSTITAPVHIQYDFLTEFGHLFIPNQIALLKRLYLWQSNHETHFDWDCEYLAVILKASPEFLLQLLDDDDGYSARYERRPMQFLWQTDGYDGMIYQALEKMADGQLIWDNEALQAFFPKSNEPAIKERMRAFLNHAFTQFNLTPKIASVLIRIVQENFRDELPTFLGLLFQTLPNNPDGLFEKLEFFPSSRMAGSSWIPLYQEDQKLWEGVLETIDHQPQQTAALFSYRAYVLRQIHSLAQQIDDEAESNFADPY
jgi:hypothetical protein